MKTSMKHRLTIVLFFILFVFLLGCGSAGDGTSSANKTSQNPRGDSSLRLDVNPQNPLIGTWVSRGYSLTFNPDGTYVRDFNHEGIPAVQGSVAMSGNVLIVTDSGSCLSTGITEKNTSGSYTYILSGNTLTFSLFHDSCNDRAAFFELTYVKQ